MYADYPVNENLIYLNNCGTTPAGSHIIEEVVRFMEEYGRRGIYGKGFGYEQVKGSIQSVLARLLKCEPGDCALVHNTAEGMNLVSYGLDLAAKDEIILLENEYPSNYYPWEHWTKKGVRLLTVPAYDDPAQFLEELGKRVSAKTKVISLSAVHWCTGARIPLKEVGKLCREAGILFVVDGAQGAGHIPINMGWGIDVLAFSAWKWLMGPLGLAVLVIPRSSLGKIGFVFKGTESVTHPRDYLPYRQEIKPDAQRYLYSTGSFIDWVYFDASLRYLDDIGFDSVMGRIEQLSGCLKEKLASLGFEPGSPNSAGILAVRRPGTDSADCAAWLKKNDCVCAVRLGALRFSPHIYNSFEQMDRVAGLLGKYI